MQDTVLRLIRTADQLVHSDHYDAASVKERLNRVDIKSEEFMIALDSRRRNLSLAVTFFLLAKTVSLVVMWFLLLSSEEIRKLHFWFLLFP